MNDIIAAILGAALGMILTLVLGGLFWWRLGREERHQRDIERRLGITRTPDADPAIIRTPRVHSSKSWKR